MSIREHNEKKEIGNILTGNEYKELKDLIDDLSLNTNLVSTNQSIENEIRLIKKDIKNDTNKIERLTQFQSKIDCEIHNHIVE